jgi:hypothetical protein
MTTTMRRGNKTITLTIAQKAALLYVFDVHPELKANEIAVSSGTAQGCAYVCEHDGRITLNCTCRTYGNTSVVPACAHRVAGNWFLEARNRAALDALCNPNNVE